MREKKERNKMIMEKIAKGEYLVDIAKEFNISPQMVCKIKKRYEKLLEKKLAENIKSNN